MKQKIVINIPSREDLRLLVRLLHDHVDAHSTVEDLAIIDGLIAVLEVCAEFHRNQLLQAHEIDNSFDEE